MQIYHIEKQKEIEIQDSSIKEDLERIVEEEVVESKKKIE